MVKNPPSNAGLIPHVTGQLSLQVLSLHNGACVLCHFSHVYLFVTLWTVAQQAPLSMYYLGKNTAVCYHFLLQRFWSRDQPRCFMSPALAGMSLGGPIKETHRAATIEAHTLQWKGHTPQMKAQLSQKKNKKNDVCYTVSYPPNYQRIKELQRTGKASVIGLKNLYPDIERLWNYIWYEWLKIVFKYQRAVDLDAQNTVENLAFSEWTKIHHILVF